MRQLVKNDVSRSASGSCSRGPDQPVSKSREHLESGYSTFNTLFVSFCPLSLDAFLWSSYDIVFLFLAGLILFSYAYLHIFLPLARQRAYLSLGTCTSMAQVAHTPRFGYLQKPKGELETLPPVTISCPLAPRPFSILMW